MSDEEQVKLIQQIADAAEKLGWEVLIPVVQDFVPGLIVGTGGFIETTRNALTLSDNKKKKGKKDDDEKKTYH